jgi:hypothetical protein
MKHPYIYPDRFGELRVFCNRCGFHHSRIKHLKDVIGEFIGLWFKPVFA